MRLMQLIYREKPSFYLSSLSCQKNIFDSLYANDLLVIFDLTDKTQQLYLNYYYLINLIFSYRGYGDGDGDGISSLFEGQIS